ncbi:MAG: VacJ family lipoprotein [Myxococcota bacterium]|jgi:phospholipid-binding lipoprotein MlaA|nr:VacJ family lipoprotein [Myxococcota bacterium]
MRSVSLAVVWVLGLALLVAAVPAAAEDSPADSPEQLEDPFFPEGPDPLFDDDYEDETGASYPDPLEETNRGVFAFNQGVDTFFLGPITRFFGWVTPEPAKVCLRNFFTNVNYPVVFINDVMQLEWKDAAVVTGAFVVNSTVGIAGFFEPGKHIGLPRHDSDFDQTLALARVPSGPYLVMPIAGPTTARGTVGQFVDFFLQPTNWLFPGVGNLYYVGGYHAGGGVVTLEQYQEQLDELERSSVDFYPVLRSAFYQNRSDEIWGRRQERRIAGFD